MKTYLCVMIIALVLIELSFSLSLRKTKSNSKGNHIGIAYNLNSANIPAATFGKASTQNEMKTSLKYSEPIYVDNVETKIKVKPNPLELVDVIETPEVYYDKTEKLNVVEINCSVYENKEECGRQVECGWCYTDASCIRGNKDGPVQTCSKENYIYSFDSDDEN